MLALVAILLCSWMPETRCFFADIDEGRYVTNIESKEHFRAEIESSTQAFVMFYSPFCSKCRFYYNTFERIAEELQLRNVKV